MKSVVVHQLSHPCLGLPGFAGGECSYISTQRNEGTDHNIELLYSLECKGRRCHSGELMGT